MFIGLRGECGRAVRFIQLLYLTAALTAAAGWSASAYAATIVPQAQATVEGNNDFGWTSAATFQELIGTSHLTGVPVGTVITGFQLRLDAAVHSR